MAQTILEVRDLTLAQKRDVWTREGAKYALTDGLEPGDMANVFNLTYGQIKRALELSKQEAERSGESRISKNALQRGCRALFKNDDTGKAVRIPPAFEWDDLVLPRAQKEALLRACNQVRNKHRVFAEWGFDAKMPYGAGLSMIFTGPPGTGKTMAAQVFARELGVELYKVELSAVVSKFVGETEKNLDEIFHRAERSRIALFFDEADVLFSKRTEVRDSNDKYSNMEAAFLLQKMESYEGVTILATNLIQNFDEAFKRRVKFIIDFPFPDKLRREELWRKAFPAELPLGEIDFAFLSESFELSGSNIRNIALHAAFLAAERDCALGMTEIIPAVLNEYAKSGKILTSEDVGEYFMLLPEVR